MAQENPSSVSTCKISLGTGNLGYDLSMAKEGIPADHMMNKGALCEGSNHQQLVHRNRQISVNSGVYTAIDDVNVTGDTDRYVVIVGENVNKNAGKMDQKAADGRDGATDGKSPNKGPPALPGPRPNSKVHSHSKAGDGTEVSDTAVISQEAVYLQLVSESSSLDPPSQQPQESESDIQSGL